MFVYELFLRFVCTGSFSFALSVRNQSLCMYPISLEFLFDSNTRKLVGWPLVYRETLNTKIHNLVFNILTA